MDNTKAKNHKLFANVLQFEANSLLLKSTDELFKEVQKEFTNLINEDATEQMKRAQNLTFGYDKIFKKGFESPAFFVKTNDGNDEVCLNFSLLKNNENKEYYPLNFYEVVFLLLTHFRRMGSNDNFLDLYNKFSEIKGFFDTPLMQSNQFTKRCVEMDGKYYSNLAKCRDLKKLKETLGDGFHILTCVVYADRIQRYLNEAIVNREANINNEDSVNLLKSYCDDALAAIQRVLDKDEICSYPLYRYIRAKLSILKLKYIDTENESLIGSISKDLNSAIADEKEQEKKTRYLNFLAEFNQYQEEKEKEKLRQKFANALDKEIKKQDIKTKNFERRSIKIIAMFSAFVSFAVGVISRLNSSENNFTNTASMFLLLLGIALVIFFVLDVIVLDHLLPVDEEKRTGKKPLLERIWFKSIIELSLAAVSIVLSILIGTGVI